MYFYQKFNKYLERFVRRKFSSTYISVTMYFPYRSLIWIQLICLYYKHIVKRGNYHVSAKSNLVEKSLFVLLHLVMQNPKKVIVRLSPNCFFVLTLFLLIIVCHLSHCSTSKYYLHIKTHVFYFLYFGAIRLHIIYLSNKKF